MTVRLAKPGCALFLLLTGAFQTASGQQIRRTPSGPPADLKVDVALALIPVTVTDSPGNPVRDLARGNFRLFEDGIEQTIQFAGGEDRPVSVCLVFDLSASMRNKMRAASAAMTHLLESFDEQGDEFCLVAFNERPRLAVSFTGDASRIGEALFRSRPLGRTALLDAIHMARVQMKSAHNTRRAVVIISDGGDNHSRLTREAIWREMRESDMQVYAMSVTEPESKRPPKEAPEVLNGPVLLNDIARQSGGRHLELARISDLQLACAEIARNLHNQYLLGYSPAAQDGRSHRLAVEAVGGDGTSYRVQHRAELYVPAH
jgi:Ca-activated chloride channel family protein